jgi:hypothetical protein
VQETALIRKLRSPITEQQLRPLDPQCQVVQFNAPLTDDDFLKLAGFMENYSQVSLRIYGHHQRSTDLSFLRHFPFLKRFQADVLELDNWDGLRFLPDTVEFLALGATRRQFSLAPIARFAQLTRLHLDGHRKDIAVVGDLSALVYLTLRSITLTDLGILRRLRKLHSLALKLGGTNRLAPLNELSSLRYLELWRVRGLSDLSALTTLPQLRDLFLQDLTNVRSLPSFRPLQNLRRCYIQNLKHLTDLSPIAEAPYLEEFLLISMRHISVDGLKCFQGHPTLKAATIGLGSMRRNALAAEMLGLGQVSNKPYRDYVESG